MSSRKMPNSLSEIGWVLEQSIVTLALIVPVSAARVSELKLFLGFSKLEVEAVCADEALPESVEPDFTSPPPHAVSPITSALAVITDNTFLILCIYTPFVGQC